ncbi:unnamed protein product, partial [Closterium sp. NIES-53]
PHPFPPVLPPSATHARSPLPSSRLFVCASSRRGGSRPAPRGFSVREAMRGGVDSEGRQYASADEMWRQETGERAVSAGEGGGGEGAMEGELGGKKREWYDKGVKYWEGVEASVDGVLGGYGAVSSTDAAGSAAFLHEVYGTQLEAARSQGRPLVALGACSAVRGGGGGGGGGKGGSAAFLHEVYGTQLDTARSQGRPLVALGACTERGGGVGGGKRERGAGWG